MNDIRKLLKPCPFCGRALDNVTTKYEYGVCVNLQASCSCGADVDIRVDVNAYYSDGTPWRFGDSAIDIWNTRKVKEDEHDG